MPDLGMLQPGVYTMPFLSESGHAILFAVDAHGRRVREIVVGPGEDPAEAGRTLRAALKEASNA